jgi:hypothetical protein
VRENYYDKCESLFLILTAKRLHNTAQGRAAHPGRKQQIYFLVLPGLQWVKLGFPASSLRTISLKIRLFRGVQCQATTVKEDGSLHVLPIVETKGVFFTPSIFALSPSQVALVIQ